MKPGDTIKIQGGTFTAAPEPTEFGVSSCDGCAGHGKHRDALCAIMPMGCGDNFIIWVAGTDPATLVTIAEFELEST
jgi:hypothetical protein